jgi:hypothetical protein
VVAAATPFRRGRALSLLRSDLSYRCQPDRRVLERAVAANAVLDRCRASFDLLMDHHQLAWALRQWEHCPNPERAYLPVTPAYALGNFADASARARAAAEAEGGAGEIREIPGFAWQLFVRAHLLAGEPGRAAEAMKGLVRAEELELAEENAGSMREVAKVRLQTLRCVAATIDHLAGDVGAIDALAALTRATGRVSCGVLWAAAVPPARRAAILDAVEPLARSSSAGFGGEGVARELHQLQRAIAGRSIEPPGDFGRPVDLLIRPDTAVDAVSDVTYRQAALEQLAAEDAPDPARRHYRALLAFQVGRAQLVLGRGQAARQAFEQLATDLAALKDEALPRVDRITFPSAKQRAHWGVAHLAALEARLGQFDRAEELLAPILHSRYAAPVWAVLQLREGLDRIPGSLARLLDRGSRQHRPWVALAAGDGAGVYRCMLGSIGYQGPVLWLGAERLKGGKEGMRDLVRWGRKGQSLYSADTVKERLGDLNDRLLAARALGQAELVGHLERIRARFREALEREEIAVALVLLDGE